MADFMARVAHSTSIPVATGERLVSKYDFVDLLEKQAAAILQLALARVAGLLEARKIAGMAEAHCAQMAPHLYAWPIEAAANIQLGTFSPNFLIQESIETFVGFYADLLIKPIQWQEGCIIPSTEPGLGVELNEAVTDANPFTKDVVSPPMAEAPVIKELAQAYAPLRHCSFDHEAQGTRIAKGTGSNTIKWELHQLSCSDEGHELPSQCHRVRPYAAYNGYPIGSGRRPASSACRLVVHR